MCTSACAPPKKRRRSARAGRGNSGTIRTVYGPNVDWRDVMANWMVQGQAVLIKGAAEIPTPTPPTLPKKRAGKAAASDDAAAADADEGGHGSPSASAETWWTQPAESLAAVMAADESMVDSTWCIERSRPAGASFSPEVGKALLMDGDADADGPSTPSKRDAARGASSRGRGKTKGNGKGYGKGKGKGKAAAAATEAAPRSCWYASFVLQHNSKLLHAVIGTLPLASVPPPSIQEDLSVQHVSPLLIPTANIIYIKLIIYYYYYYSSS